MVLGNAPKAKEEVKILSRVLPNSPKVMAKDLRQALLLGVSLQVLPKVIKKALQEILGHLGEIGESIEDLGPP